jgi:hypothetical protein
VCRNPLSEQAFAAESSDVLVRFLLARKVPSGQLGVAREVPGQGCDFEIAGFVQPASASAAIGAKSGKLTRLAV